MTTDGFSSAAGDARRNLTPGDPNEPMAVHMPERYKDTYFACVRGDRPLLDRLPGNAYASNDHSMWRYHTGGYEWQLAPRDYATAFDSNLKRSFLDVIGIPVGQNPVYVVIGTRLDETETKLMISPEAAQKIVDDPEIYAAFAELLEAETQGMNLKAGIQAEPHQSLCI
ncbi:MAG: hypothetical protein H6844_19195 [Alphaproteobacteria bacterium]|nr:hypothetical protein [Alphaproteobacteria bacterium]